MKPFKNSQVPEDWKEIARMDWQRVKRNLRDEDAPAAGFYLQQCLEKFLKAFLLTQGWQLKKIHKLDTLLDEAINYRSDLQDFYDLCERVSGYYLADRYPPFGDLGLTCADIEGSLGEAKRFIQTMFPEDKLDG
jgi:HEPN domain-containing protein